MSITLVCKSNSKCKLCLSEQDQHYLSRIIALLDFNIDFQEGVPATTCRRISSAISRALESGNLLEFSHNSKTIPYINHASRKLPGTVHPVSGNHLLVIRRFCDFVSKTVGIKICEE